MSRATYYAARGRTPRNCWTCDSPAVSKSVRRRLGPSVHLERDCSCSGATIRAAKRGARIQWQREAANDVEDMDRDDSDAWDDWCPSDCPCSIWNAEWLDWLRSRPVYPEPVLAVPLIERCA